MSLPEPSTSRRPSRRLCSTDLALAANKRADLFLRGRLLGINSEREHCNKLYHLNRLKLTRNLLAIEKSSAQCRQDNFNPDNYPSGMWEVTRDIIPRRSCTTTAGGIRSHRSALPAIPTLLYGEEPSAFLTRRDQDLFSETNFSSDDEGNRDPILVDIRRIKDEACAREPKKLVRKTISVNRFVNEFEWLDTRHTKWFMEKTTKLYHEKLMNDMDSEVRLKKEKELKFKLNDRPSKFMLA